MIKMTMSLLEEQSSYKEPSSPIGMTKLGLAALFVTPNPKKMMETVIDSRFVDDEPFIDERKQSITRVVKGTNTSYACGLPSSPPPQQPAAKAAPVAFLHDLANI